MSRRHTVLGGVLLVGALIGAACGGDDSDDAATTTTGSATTAAGATSTSAATATTAGKQPATWAEWEQDGAERRAAVVKRIKDNNWGLSADGKTLTGPEGFTVDIGACPSGWSNTEGLTRHEHQVRPHAGLLRDAGRVRQHRPRHGELHELRQRHATEGSRTRPARPGRCSFIQKDDGYDPARTIPLIDELLDSDKVFALSRPAARPTSFRVYDKVNQRCVPQPIGSPRPPGLGRSGQPPVDGRLHPRLQHRGDPLGHLHRAEPGPRASRSPAIDHEQRLRQGLQAGFKAFMAQSKHDIDFEFETIEPSGAEHHQRDDDADRE